MLPGRSRHRKPRVRTDEVSDTAYAVISVTAMARVGIGLAALLAPRAAATVLFSNPAPASSVAIRMFGIRDLAMGLGILQGPAPASQFAAWTGVCDAGDVFALMVDRGRTVRPAVRVVGIAAGLAAVSTARLVSAIPPRSGRRAV